jgi:hypothetical protein
MKGNKTMKRKQMFTIFVVLSLMMGISGWNTDSVASGKQHSTLTQQQTLIASREKAVAAEINPTGDIPDSQVFITYVSPVGGYELEVPEGWARTDKGGDVFFTDKLNGLSVQITNESSMPSTESIGSRQAKLLERAVRAFKITRIQKIKLRHGTAIRLAYESNSDPNPVTSKQVRLENSIYYYYRNGKLAAVRVWAPLGADNIDQWNLISNSFLWR